MGQGGHLVLINGTKHDWNLGNVHSYQMNSWNGKFPSVIMAGTSVMIYVEWDEGAFVYTSDDGGEAVYALSELGYSFQLQARATPHFHIQVIYSNFSNLGDRTVDLGWNHDGNMPFYTSGAPGRFISTGTTDGAISWMHDNLGDFGQKTLKQLSIAGSHDAGMSVVQNGTAFSNEGNTKTQHLDIANQLNCGVRFFDIRPIIGGAHFFTGHYSKVGVGFQGARGQSMQSIVDQINAFTSGRNELIILYLSHTFNTDIGNESYREFNQEEWNRLFLLLNQINHLFTSDTNANVNLVDIPLKDFIMKSSAVCIVVDNNNVDLGTNRHKGFYHGSEFNKYDNYSDTNHLNTMINDQTRKMNDEQNNYFLLSWTLTEQGAEVIFGPTIEHLAKEANTSLHKLLPPNFHLGRAYPNIILEDYISSDAAAMALLVNYFSEPKT